MAGAIYIPLISVFNSKGVKEAKTGLAALTGVVKNLRGASAAIGVGFGASKIMDFVKSSVSQARDLESAQIGLRSAFGDLTPAMEKFAKDAQAIGLSQLDATRASTFFGNALQSAGLSTQDTAKKAKVLIGIGSDLAATFGLPIEEALTGMGAAFRGEYDPIERFGVAIKQAQVNALLAARGQKNLTGAALASAQAQARYDLILKATARNQGNFAKASDTLYVKQAKLKAQFENMKATLGAELIPALSELLGAVIPLIKPLGAVLTPVFQALGKVIKVFMPIIEPLVGAFMAIVEAVMPLVDVVLSLLEPLLVPLADIFSVLMKMIKPLIPVITLLARVIGAILIPVVTTVSLAFELALKFVGAFLDALSQIPGVGDWFKGANKSLKDFTDTIGGLPGQLKGTTNANDDLTNSLSKSYPTPDISGVTTANNKVVDSAKKSADKVTKIYQDAKDVQKGLLDSLNITSLLGETTTSIAESVIYIDGKFKAVTSGIQKNSTSIVDAFKNNLAKIKTFYSNLNKLIGMKLDRSLIDQIVSAGPEAGNATAEAIIASGKTGVSELNKTFRGIKSIAGDIGAKTANIMQQTGEDIGNGLIDGIKAQSNKLQAAAVELATDFNKAFKDAILPEKKASPGAYAVSGDTGQRFFNTSNKNTYVAKVKAGATGMANQQFNLMQPNQFTNPFAANELGYSQFQKDVATANKYHIAINVAPGTSARDVGSALVQAIQEYERAKGKVFSR